MASVSDNGVREREQRVVYLATYSRADLNKIPTREAFAEALAQAWIETADVKIQQWVVSMEQHSAASCSNAENSCHFHMALKLEKRARWLRVRKYLDERFGIQVNFSSHHNTYYSAYKYTTKEDSDAVHSSEHPDLQNAAHPKTEQAIAQNKRKGQSGSKRQHSSKKRRKRGLSAYEVTQLILSKNISSRLQLMAFAAAQNREG